jgi:hypothetical protein
VFFIYFGKQSDEQNCIYPSYPYTKSPSFNTHSTPVQRKLNDHFAAKVILFYEFFLNIIRIPSAFWIYCFVFLEKNNDGYLYEAIERCEN